MLPQSTMAPGEERWPSRPGRRRRRTPLRGRVDPDDLPAGLVAGQLDLVGPDDPAADEVDEVARHEVLGQEQLAGPPLEAAEVDLGAVEGHPPRLDGRDLPGGHEQLAPSDLHDEAGDRRVRAVADARDEVLHAPETVTRPGVDERALEDAREVDELSGHGDGGWSRCRGAAWGDPPGSRTWPPAAQYWASVPSRRTVAAGARPPRCSRPNIAAELGRRVPPGRRGAGAGGQPWRRAPPAGAPRAARLDCHGGVLVARLTPRSGRPIRSRLGGTGVDHGLRSHVEHTTAP